LSMGAVQDLQTATAIARDLAEVHGMGGPEVGIARYRADDDNGRRRHDLSETRKETIDRAIHEILETQRQRASEILRDKKRMLEMLRDLLLEKKTLEAKTLQELVTTDTKEEGRKRARKPKEGVTKGGPVFLPSPLGGEGLGVRGERSGSGDAPIVLRPARDMARQRHRARLRRGHNAD